MNPVTRPWLIPALIFLVCWTLTTHGKYSASGDEPHYLMVCQSLWADGDLDLRNNYQNNDGRLFGAAGLEVGLHARENGAGRLFPAHDIGVPLLLTPIYVVATSVAGVSSESILNRFRMNRGLFAYSLISLCIIGLVTTAAVFTQSALIAQGTAPALASGVAIVAWLSPPVLSNSFLIFPEPFALWVTALALHYASSDADRASGSARHSRGEMILATVLGLLPWFHRKYAMYAAALALVVVWQRRERLNALETRTRGLLLASFVVPQIALAVWTWYVWGNLGGPLMFGGAPFSWEAFRNGVFGSLIDRENGLLVWAPVYVLLPAAWALAGKGHLRWLLPVGSLFLLSAAHIQWWGGFSPAARFLVPLVPIFPSVYARAMGHRPLAYACMILLIPQLFIAPDGWQHTRSLWPQGDGHNRILSDLLGLVGASETLIPSLRTSNAIRAAMIGAIGLGLVNLLGWAVVKQYAPHYKRVGPRISSTD